MTPAESRRAAESDLTIRSRPWWAAALAAGCALTLVFLLSRDLFIPQVRDTEVWFGFELTGWSARLTAPLHWLVYGAGTWGFWRQRSWIWPWASVYAGYVALGHLVWNLVSPSGGGWLPGLWQLALFSLPAFALLWARPPNPSRSGVVP